MSFAKEVWDNLSKINVNEHVEKKMDLSFLSWAWAWKVLMDNYPESEFDFLDDKKLEDGTVTVHCVVAVKDGDKSLVRAMWLPVMDHKNMAIKNPDSRKISDSKMRCLTKCLALFGLGHYIYAGEDLPSADPGLTPADPELPDVITQDQIKRIRDALVVSKMTEEQFCKLARIQSIENLESQRFEGALNMLKQRAVE